MYQHLRAQSPSLAVKLEESPPPPVQLLSMQATPWSLPYGKPRLQCETPLLPNPLGNAQRIRSSHRGIGLKTCRAVRQYPFCAEPRKVGLRRAPGGGAQDELAIGMYEEHVRYHVLCNHELCEDGANVADPDGFSPFLNTEQLNKVGAMLPDGEGGGSCAPVSWVLPDGSFIPFCPQLGALSGR